MPSFIVESLRMVNLGFRVVEPLKSSYFSTHRAKPDKSYGDGYEEVIRKSLQVINMETIRESMNVNLK